jgi:hypothetical protein
VASAAFALYVANFASYNKTYGTLGGVISFLVWLWISNIAVLLGAEFNAELERGRRLAAGEPARLCVVRDGPRVIDERRALALAAERVATHPAARKIAADEPDVLAALAAAVRQPAGEQGRQDD